MKVKIDTDTHSHDFNGVSSITEEGSYTFLKDENCNLIFIVATSKVNFIKVWSEQ